MKTKTNNWKTLIAVMLFTSSGYVTYSQSDPDVLFTNELTSVLSQLENFNKSYEDSLKYVAPEENEGTGPEEANSNNYALFLADMPIEMTLQFDIGSFIKGKKKPELMDAVCTLIWEGDTAVKKIQIKARGEMRRLYCQFPPIMLKFGNGTKDSFPLSGSLKFVVPCFPTLKYENYVMKEYLVYRLYNEVTPYSLKTRLVKINLIDNSKSTKSYTAYGFLIENEKRMAERNNAVLIKNPNLTQRHMNPVDVTRTALFNYIMGNTDWSVPMQHNIRVLKINSADADKGIPVAYDFDYAGFVNPPYAAPAEGLPITEVTERYYLGMCDNNHALEDVIEEFSSLESKFLATIEDFDYLTGLNKKYSLAYVEDFFRAYKNKDALQSMLSKTCKQ